MNNHRRKKENIKRKIEQDVFKMCSKQRCPQGIWYTLVMNIA
jgi:hypothetical protein